MAVLKIISNSVRFFDSKSLFAGFLFGLLFITSSRGLAVNQCIDIFVSTQTVITELKRGYVYRVKAGDKDLVYKIYRGEGRKHTYMEAESLLMFADLMNHARPNSTIQVSKGVRVTTENEFGVFDRARFDNNLKNEGPLQFTALVTEYSPAKQVTEIMEDPGVSVAKKAEIIEKFHNEIDFVLDWLAENPGYRYKGSRVTVKEEGYETFGEILDFKSSDGVYLYYLRNVVFDLKGRQNSGVDLWLDGFSNMTLNERGVFTLFDPY